MRPLIAEDAIVLGVLLFFLASIFKTSSSSHGFWKKLYTYVPALLLCYILPGLMNSFGIIDGEASALYTVSSQYLLPAALILLTSTADVRAILRLGDKALFVFLAGTVGIILGGPIALWLVSEWMPSFGVQASEAGLWKGLVTIAGSWIGGSSSQLALKEIYGCGEELFAIILIVDALVANTWTACLIYGAGFSDRIDRWLKADSRSIEEVKKRIQGYKQTPDRPATVADLAQILALGFGGAALARAGASGFVYLLAPYEPFLESQGLAPFLSEFLWVVIFSTTLGIALSFTKARSLEKVGAVDLATLFIYFLIMTIGMRLNIFALEGNLGLLAVVCIWMLIHIVVMFIAARLLRAPYFFVAVGSQANIGGVATAPAVASVFHPALAPVGVLLAVLSHILGTYGGIVSAWLMQQISN
ncbi:MAG: DUF819 domain-containing protein [Haliscomenobacter sp.]